MVGFGTSANRANKLSQTSTASTSMKVNKYIKLGHCSKEEDILLLFTYQLKSLKMRSLLNLLLTISALTTLTTAHGSHGAPEGEIDDWATRHMIGTAV